MPNPTRTKRRALARSVSVIRGSNELTVKNLAESANINLLGTIGKSWMDDTGITEGEFRNALDSIPAGKPIQINLNSQGGNVDDGLGIYHAISERSADISVKVTGYACSIASILPLGAGNVIAPKSSIWMIHCAWAFAQGNAADMRKSADMLDVHDESMCGIYCDHTGLSKKKVMEMMQAETWMNGSDAVEMGLADEMDDDEDDQASASIKPLSDAYLARCKNVPQNILAAVTRDTHSAIQPEPSPALAAAANVPTTFSGSSPENSTIQPTNTMPDSTIPAPVTTAPSNDVLAQVQAQLANERRARITAEVTRRAENRITNANLNWWIDRAVADEAGTLAQIDSMPLAHIGTEPLVGSGIELMPDNYPKGWTGSKPPTEAIANIYKQHSTPKSRLEVMRMEWPSILATAMRKDGFKGGVFAANSYSATITTNFLILGATTQLSPKLAAVKAFTRDVSVDPYKPLATGVMKFTQTLQDGSTVQTNATNFENTNSTVNPISITVSQYSNGGSITNSDLNSGFRMEDISRAVLMGLGSKIIAVATAPITVANFGSNAPQTYALNPNAFGFNESRIVYAGVPLANTRNLILDVPYTAGLLNQPGYFQKAIEQESGPGHWTNVYGFDNLYENTIWTGADPNVHGFYCDPQAIGCIAGLPLIDNAGIPGGILSVSTGVIPGCELPIAVYMWFSTSTRTYWLSFDMMFGAAKMDATAGLIIKSA